MRAVWWQVISLVLVACADGKTTVVRTPAQAVVHGVPVAPISQYRLLPLTDTTRQQLDFGDDGLRIYAGLRIKERAGRQTFADTFAAPVLNHGRRLPTFAGGGFLFWSDFAMFRAETFLGRLQPLLGTPSPVERVGLGPGYLIAFKQGGGHMFLDAKTGATVLAQPLGLIDVAAAGDGRVVSTLQFERYTVSLDNNRTTREVQAELGGPVRGLSEEPLGFVLDSGIVIELKADGSLIKNGYQAVGSNQSLRWPGQDSPLERAVSAGVQRGSGRALAAIGSAVAEVDLRTGELLSLGPQLLPGDPQCELFEQGSELLMQCKKGPTVSVLSKLDALPPHVEQVFRVPAKLRFNKTQAFADVSCESKLQPLSVCVRQAGGGWKTVTAPLGANSASAVVSYGFKLDGGIVAFVDDNLDEGAPADPARHGYVDLGTGKLTPFGGAQPLRRQIAGASCRVERDGGVRCLSTNGGFSFAAAGGSDVGSDPLNPAPFSWLGSHLEQVLAFDHYQGMTAAVRWSAERVCIEAVEVGEAAAQQMDPPPQLRVVAYFGAKPSAARLATIQGVDWRQTLSCELRPGDPTRDSPAPGGRVLGPPPLELPTRGAARHSQSL
jgi:hypothetical protein